MNIIFPNDLSLFLKRCINLPKVLRRLCIIRRNLKRLTNSSIASQFLSTFRLFSALYINSEKVMLEIAKRLIFVLKISNASLGLRLITLITILVSSKYLSITALTSGPTFVTHAHSSNRQIRRGHLRKSYPICFQSVK